MFNLITNSTTTLQTPANLADWNILSSAMPKSGGTSCNCTTTFPTNQTTVAHAANQILVFPVFALARPLRPGLHHPLLDRANYITRDLEVLAPSVPSVHLEFALQAVALVIRLDLLALAALNVNPSCTMLLILLIQLVTVINLYAQVTGFAVDII